MLYSVPKTIIINITALLSRNNYFIIEDSWSIHSFSVRNSKSFWLETLHNNSIELAIQNHKNTPL